MRVLMRLAVLLTLCGSALSAPPETPGVGQLRIVNTRLLPENAGSKPPALANPAAVATTSKPHAINGQPRKWPDVSSGKAGGRAFVVPRSSNGMFYLDGRVNGVPVRFRIDPSLPHAAVDGKLSRMVGLRSGRSGKVMVANTEVKAMIGAGRIDAGEVYADTEIAVYSFPFGGDTAVLGQSFLAKFAVTEASDRLTIAPK